MADGGVSVEQVVSLLTRRRARLPFEIGAFVALEACERLVAQGPAVVEPADVHIDPEGHVSVVETAASGSSAEAARSVARVLARLLVAAGHGVPPALVELVEQGPEGAGWDLVRLRDELEASLVPLNRAAARRVLARVLRDAGREAPVPATVPEASPSDVDAELDAFLGDDAPAAPGPASPSVAAPTAAARPAPRPAPPPPSTAPAASAPPSPATTEGVAPTHPAPSAAAPPPPSREEATPFAVEAPVERPSSDLRETPVMDPSAHVGEPSGDPGPTTMPREPAVLDLDDPQALDDLPTGNRRARLLALGSIVLLAALVAVVAVVRPDILARLAGRGGLEGGAVDDAAGRADEQRRLAEAHRRRFGQLTVHVEPERAQVLRYVGRGPASAEDLPVGVAHEFVATAPGHLPARAVVPPEAEWTASEGEGGPRYELAMQTGEASRHAREYELGATKLPKDMGRPGGALGTVRVITNPPGAKVYHLIGFAPEVKVQDLDTTRAHELLVYAEGHAPERVVVGPSDWEPTDAGRPAATLQVSLERTPTRRGRK